MINNTEELKKLITWAKENKVKSLKIGEISFELSELSFIEDIELSQDRISSNVGEYNNDTLTDTLDSNEDEALLFWSTNS